jgi:beta-N-acetylhexosaminidase
VKAAIVGVAGPTLGRDEAALLRAEAPAGAILFARNVEDPAQLARLVGALREALPHRACVLVDQEGGRVARLRPPHWPARPRAAALGALHARDEAAGLRAAWLAGALVGLDCAEAGFDVACAPVLDLAVPGATGAIGDRAFAAEPRRVAALGGAFAAGLLAAGVQPVAKHAPGHGRATVDSHESLPHVGSDASLDADMVPFAANAGLPWMMTAHVLYEALDPGRPATLSPRVIGTVIRGQIGFAGVLVSDDLAMGALSGEPGARAAAAVAAGCDLALHCSGRFEDSAAVLAAVPECSPAALDRLAAARALAQASRQDLERPALEAELARLLR